MSDTLSTGPDANDGSEWNRAWDVVTRLAAAREALAVADQPTRDAAHMTCPDDTHADTASAVPPAPVTPDQLARDIAEIERAAAALRDQEPSLEIHRAAAPIEESTPRSVWTLVAGIWIFAAVVVCGLIGAIALIVS
jgi:hypothetical protein